MAGRRRRTDEPSPRPRVPTIDRVRKRDGREVAFEVAKIEAAIQAAMHAVGERDESFAGEVARVVELTLARGAERRAAPPGIEEIQDLVERALMELGKPEVAKAYILYREARARRRAALRVHGQGSAARRTVPRVREAEGVSRWSRGRIVAALVEEAELSRAVAEEIACAVEERVLASSPRHVTTGLVRELVASELFERGLTGALERLSRIGLGRHDVRRALAGRALESWRELDGGPRDAAAVTRTLGGELLRRFVLADVLPDGVAELHQAGDLFLEGLEEAHRPLSLALGVDLLAAGSGVSRRAAAVLDGASALAGEATRHLVLEEAETLLEPLLAAGEGALEAWLPALSAVARARGVRIGLSLGEGVEDELVGALVAHLAGAADPGLELFLPGPRLADFLGQRPDHEDEVERLLARDRLALPWGAPGERFAAPGARRLDGERGAIACAGAVGLHLPRLARRAGTVREEILQSGLTDLVHAALEAARALVAFQGETARRGPFGLSVRPSFALVPVGLREALLLAGDGEIDPDQGARWLGLLAEAAGRFGLEGAATVAPSAYFGEESARRLAWVDARSSEVDGPRQPSLFDEAERPEPKVYGTGLRISPVACAPPGAAEARLFRTLAGSVWRGGPLAAEPGEPCPNLAAWRRFHAQRGGERAEPGHELFPLRARPRTGPEPGRSRGTPTAPTSSLPIRPLP